MQLGIIVKNLRQQKVKSIDEAMHLLHFGEEFRVVYNNSKKYRVTDYNDHSSRSHTIFKIYIEATEMSPKGRKKVYLSCLVRKILIERIWSI